MSYNADEVKARLEKLEDDDFKDAVQEDDDEGIVGEFRVSEEELSLIRAELATEFPEDYLYLSDSYILSVASKPYSKDPTVRRPIEYSQEKLQHVMQWRAEAGAPEMEELVQLAMGPANSAEALQEPEKYTKAVAMVKCLNNGSLYWHGFTVDGRPILWIRTNRKPWYPDVDAEVNALILMADAGIRAMPAGVTDFCVVAESSYPPPPNPNYMISVLKALVRGYPDRLHILYSAPVSGIVQFVMNLLLPLMPGRLASKVCLLGLDEVKQNLTPLLQNGAKDLPDFFGGPNVHDAYYPEESKCNVKPGGGVLKFDYFGMMDRLHAARDEYLNSKKA
jgi:CRAL/TRIO domain